MTAAAAALSIAAAAAAALFGAAEGALLAKPLAHGTSMPDETGEADRDHRALVIGRRLAQLAAAAAAAVALELGASGGWMALLGVLAIAVVLAATTEVGARTLGDAGGADALGRLRPVVRAVRIVVWPAIALGGRLEHALRERFPAAAPDDISRETSQERFREVVYGGLDVSRRERALLHGVFSLGDTSVSEVMVPRVDVVGVDHETPWSEVVDRVRSSEHARFPVYAETIDDVTGILHAKDLLPAVILDQEPPGGWLELVRPAHFIPGTKTLGEQLRDFKASHAHIAIVVDEYGGTAGVVTIEDVLEEIVGEIHDEYDDEEPDVVQEEGKRFWVSGRLTLDELSELLGQNFGDEAVTTVGGLIYERLGRVPVSGERLTIDGFRIVVERVVRRRVRRVYFERMEGAMAGTNR